MKKLLQPKYIIIAALCVVAFFLVRNEFSSKSDVLAAGSAGGFCPLHKDKLRLDTVKIVVRKEESDSSYLAIQKANFPMAQDTFFLLQWFQDDQFKGYTKSEVWYCPACREAKRKYSIGQ